MKYASLEWKTISCAVFEKKIDRLLFLVKILMNRLYSIYIYIDVYVHGQGQIETVPTQSVVVRTLTIPVRIRTLIRLLYDT